MAIRLSCNAVFHPLNVFWNSCRTNSDRLSPDLLYTHTYLTGTLQETKLVLFPLCRHLSYPVAIADFPYISRHCPRPVGLGVSLYVATRTELYSYSRHFLVTLWKFIPSNPALLLILLDVEYWCPPGISVGNINSRYLTLIWLTSLNNNLFLSVSPHNWLEYLANFQSALW